MTIAPTLETERLILRMPRAEDISAYAAFFADAAGLGGYGGPLRRDQAFGVLCKDIGHWIAKGFGKWVIQQRDNNAVIGGCGLVHLDGWPRSELTWWLLPKLRGRGYATEASLAVIDYGYCVLNWPRVETHMRDENTPARRLAERLGGEVIARETFPDGVTRDVFALPDRSVSGKSLA